MITRTALAGLIAALAASPAAAQAGLDVDSIFASWSAPDGPGCAVAAAQGGQRLIQRAYGSAELEHRAPNRPETIFEAGSVAKQFTAAAILLLAQDGKLMLTDDLRKHVPELPDYGAPITIDHLLTHTSGLRDWGAVAAIAGWPRGSRAHTQADAFDIIRRQRELNHAPGAEYSYTNSGYTLLALIVERVSGSPLAAFTRDRLFSPLGLTNTSWRDDFRRVVPRRAVAYSRRGESWAQDMPFEDAHGNGGLLTTVGDLLIWNEALTAGRLGGLVTAEFARRAVLSDGLQIPYARGLYVDSYKGQAEINHAGATGGYRAWLARYPDQRLSVAVLCNAGDADATNLGRRVADRFLPAPQPEVPLHSAVTSRAAERAGMFVNQRTGIPLTLATEGDRLRVVGGSLLDAVAPDRLRSNAGELIWNGPDLFRLRDANGELVFYRRVARAAPTTAELAAFAGRYESNEAGVAYIAAVEEGRLVLRLEHRPGVVIPLAPAYRDAFTHDFGGIVRFHRDAGGQIVALGYGVGRVRDLRFSRR